MVRKTGRGRKRKNEKKNEKKKKPQKHEHSSHCLKIINSYIILCINFHNEWAQVDLKLLKVLFSRETSLKILSFVLRRERKLSKSNLLFRTLLLLLLQKMIFCKEESVVENSLVQ